MEISSGDSQFLIHLGFFRTTFGASPIVCCRQNLLPVCKLVNFVYIFCLNKQGNRKPRLDLLLDVAEDGNVLSDLDIREEIDTFMFEVTYYCDLFSISSFAIFFLNFIGTRYDCIWN